MNIEPGPETDQEVADALGLVSEMVTILEGPIVPVFGTGIASAGSPVLRIYPEGLYGSPSQPFAPSRDLNDAFWAIGKLQKLVEINLMPRGYFRVNVNVYPDDAEFDMISTGDKDPAIAICRAILKYQELKDS